MLGKKWENHRLGKFEHHMELFENSDPFRWKIPEAVELVSPDSVAVTTAPSSHWVCGLEHILGGRLVVTSLNLEGGGGTAVPDCWTLQRKTLNRLFAPLRRHFPY